MVEREIGLEEKKLISIAVMQFSLFHPERVILFGSFGTKRFQQGRSDIDFCIIMDTEDKRASLTDLYTTIAMDIPYDILLYTPDEWYRNIADTTSFAYKINKEGMIIYDKI